MEYVSERKASERSQAIEWFDGTCEQQASGNRIGFDRQWTNPEFFVSCLDLLASEKEAEICVINSESASAFRSIAEKRVIEDP